MKTPTRAFEPSRFSTTRVESRGGEGDTDGHPSEPRWDPSASLNAAARAQVERDLRASTRLRRRPDGETGLFAARAIASGTSLIHRWHDDYYRGMAGWSVLTVAEIDGLPEVQRALVHRYGLDHDFGGVWGPEDAASVTTLDNFINHACEPSLAYDTSGDVVARHDLRVGDELTLDYGGFTVNYDERFDCGCGASSCRGRVTRGDWRTFSADDGWRLPPFVRRRR